MVFISAAGSLSPTCHPGCDVRFWGQHKKWERDLIWRKMMNKKANLQLRRSATGSFHLVLKNPVGFVQDLIAKSHWILNKFLVPRNSSGGQKQGQCKNLGEDFYADPKKTAAVELQRRLKS